MYLSLSINLIKSLLGGFGIKLRQLQSESSSEPKLLYGGISRGCGAGLADL